MAAIAVAEVGAGGTVGTTALVSGAGTGIVMLVGWAVAATTGLGGNTGNWGLRLGRAATRTGAVRVDSGGGTGIAIAVAPDLGMGGNVIC